MFLAKTWQQGKKSRKYWVLKRSVWLKDEKRQKQEYLAYIGTEAELTQSEAKDIAAQVSEKIGKRVTVDDLRKVKRLRIVEEGDGREARRPGSPGADRPDLATILQEEQAIWVRNNIRTTLNYDVAAGRLALPPGESELDEVLFKQALQRYEGRSDGLQARMARGEIELIRRLRIVENGKEGE